MSEFFKSHRGKRRAKMASFNFIQCLIDTTISVWQNRPQFDGFDCNRTHLPEKLRAAATKNQKLPTWIAFYEVERKLPGILLTLVFQGRFRLFIFNPQIDCDLALWFSVFCAYACLITDIYDISRTNCVRNFQRPVHTP